VHLAAQETFERLCAARQRALPPWIERDLAIDLERDQARFVGLAVDQRDADARGWDEVPEMRDRRLGDRLERARRQNRLVDLVQVREPLGIALERRLGPIALGDIANDHRIDLLPSR